MNCVSINLREKKFSNPGRQQNIPIFFHFFTNLFPTLILEPNEIKLLEIMYFTDVVTIKEYSSLISLYKQINLIMKTIINSNFIWENTKFSSTKLNLELNHLNKLKFSCVHQKKEIFLWGKELVKTEKNNSLH